MFLQLWPGSWKSLFTAFLIHKKNSLHSKSMHNEQARNQLGTLGRTKIFLRGTKNFKQCSIVLNYVQHIFSGVANPPLRPLVTGLIMSKLYCKLGLWGNFGRMHVLLSCEVCFSRELCHKADSWSWRPEFTFMQERVCDCGYRKWDKQSVHVSSFLQVSCSSNESVVQQERNNCIASSIRLSGRFDWRDFALAPAASLQSFLLQLSTWLRVVAVMDAILL